MNHHTRTSLRLALASDATADAVADALNGGDHLDAGRALSLASLRVIQSLPVGVTLGPDGLPRLTTAGGFTTIPKAKPEPIPTQGGKPL